MKYSVILPMKMPVPNPTMIEPQLPSHLGISSMYRIKKEAIAISTELAFTPLPSAFSSSLLEAPAFTLTK